MTKNDIGFNEAIRLVMNYAVSTGTETVPVLHAAGRIAARDVPALVDSPSVDASLKDGYAVISADIRNAAPDHPVKLTVVDRVAAGAHSEVCIKSGETVRILSGAPLPEGAQAVLTEEYTSTGEGVIYALADAHPGRNILAKGTDVGIGQVLAGVGESITAQRIGLLIAGGATEITVFKKPKIGLLATGSEVIMPGRPMAPGKVYASNVGLQQVWLTQLGFDVQVMSAMDSVEQISDAMVTLSKTCDVVITSGGAWKGDRDLTASVISGSGGHMVFHRLRLGPGKASGMGILNRAKVFCLPGGPSSNMFGFVLIVLPALFKMSGSDYCPYLILEGKLESAISGQADWTNLVQCDIVNTQGCILLRPQKLKSRLWAMTAHPALVVIPEGVEKFKAGETVPFICLNTQTFECRIPG